MTQHHIFIALLKQKIEQYYSVRVLHIVCFKNGLFK